MGALNLAVHFEGTDVVNDGTEWNRLLGADLLTPVNNGLKEQQAVYYESRECSFSSCRHVLMRLGELMEAGLAGSLD